MKTVKLRSLFLLTAICTILSTVSTVSATQKKAHKNKNEMNATSLMIQQAYKQFIKDPAHKKIKPHTKIQKKLNPHRFRAIAMAKKQIRKKYRWGGSTPKTGFDCSGLTQYAFKSANIHIPRTAAAQYKYAKRVSLSKIQAGDLIFFHTRRTRARVNHVGIYLGNGEFIHSPRRGKRVSIAKFNKYWKRKAVGAGRV